MATTQDLVPTGLPHGSRQETVARMKAANVPLTSEGGGGRVSPSVTAAASPAAASPATPVSREGLANFDVFENRVPTPAFQGVPQRQVLFERIRQSDNAVMQAIAERMQGYKEG